LKCNKDCEIYLLLVNGQVLASFEKIEVAENVKELVEEAFKILSGQGQVFAYSIELKKVGIFDM